MERTFVLKKDLPHIRRGARYTRKERQRAGAYYTLMKEDEHLIFQCSSGEGNYSGAACYSFDYYTVENNPEWFYEQNPKYSCNPPTPPTITDEEATRTEEEYFRLKVMTELGFTVVNKNHFRHSKYPNIIIEDNDFKKVFDVITEHLKAGWKAQGEKEAINNIKKALHI